jgi:hypothetical protein
MNLLNRPRVIRAVLIAFALCSAAAALPAQPAAAADYSNNNMMDDQIFNEVGSMTPGEASPTVAQLTPQIQSFLNGLPTTLANGMTATLSGGSQCLRYYQDTSPSWNGSTWSYGANVSAAMIIAASAVQWGMNPEVIISTLEKEESLVSGTSCDAWRYQSAMGYGCPDSGGCSSHYAGFTRQVLWGSWQLEFAEQRSYGNTAWDGDGDITYTGLMTQGARAECDGCQVFNYTGYATIDGQQVYLDNGSTASLYSYTPHLNQSFPGIFEKWFGPVFAVNTSTVSVKIVSQPAANPAVGQTVSYTYSFTNNLSSAITLGSVGVVGRAGGVTSGANRDFGWQGAVTLQAGATQQFTSSTVIQDTGAIYAWPAILYQGTYIQYNNWGATMNAHTANLSISSPLTASTSSPVAGQTVTLSATIKNNESQPITVGQIGIPIRYYGAYNYDTGWITLSSPIQPGATQTVSGSVVFDKAGPYTAWVSAYMGNQYRTLSPTLSLNTAPVTPSFILNYTETPDATPAIGEDVVVKFTLQNTLPVPITLDAVGVVGRYNSPTSGVNDDFGWSGATTFAAGQTIAFTSFASNISSLSNLYAWVDVLYHGSYVPYSKWGFGLYPHMPSLSVSTPLSINSGAGPTLNQAAAVTVSIKNNEPRPIHYSAIGIPIRFYGEYNYDTGWQGAGVLAASGQAGDTINLSGPVTFDKPGPYTIWASTLIDGRYITVGGQTQVHL